MKTIVVSAVNLNKGGPLAILQDCLAYLSERAKTENLRVIAVVYSKELAFFPNIEYVETKWPKKRWVNRLWYEYVTLKKVSKQLAPIDLWLSLHDTTPNVQAAKQVVYCHNSFSFYKWNLRDLFLAPKIAMFAIFTKYIYRTNIHKNNFLVVQQQWFKKAMCDMFSVEASKVIVSPPQKQLEGMVQDRTPDTKMEWSSDFTFLFPATADSHKNFEVICRACEILEKQWKLKGFKVMLTVNGVENTYTKWLDRRWGDLSSLNFTGYLKREVLQGYYEVVDCLLFPSKVETWGLPITEFAVYGKPMLLADLPYAHETSGGYDQVALFDPDKPEMLAEYMKKLIQGDETFLKKTERIPAQKPLAESWDTLFSIVLEDTQMDIVR